jgi:hypothetical protein
MKTTRFTLLVALAVMCLAIPAIKSSAQEPGSKAGKMMADVHPMAKDAMDMKKAKEMASPAMMKKAKEQMMAGEMMPKSMAMETTMAMAMKDEKTMKMVQEQAMAPMPEGKPMINDEQIKAAIRKVLSDPAQFQAMLQTLIMRETATNMMMANAEKPAAEMMMIPEADMKAAKMGMMGDESMTMKVAKEMMMNAMMMDKEIGMAVKEAAMKPADPAMDKMMKSDGMMMVKEKMMKEPSMKMEMAKEAMARQMAKPPAMMSDKKK